MPKRDSSSISSTNKINVDLPYTIPSVLHSVWFGKGLSKYKENYLLWRKYRPELQLNLWIAPKTMSEKAYTRLQRFAEQENIVLRDVEEHTNLALHDLVLQEIAKGNYWSAADIMKFSILDLEPGYIIDVDVSPKASVSEVDNKCKYGFLAYIYRYNDSPVQMYMHMFAAAYAHHPVIQAVIQTLESNFSYIEHDETTKEKLKRMYEVHRISNKPAVDYYFAFHVTGSTAPYVLSAVKNTYDISQMDFSTAFKHSISVGDSHELRYSSMFFEASINSQTSTAAMKAWILLNTIPNRLTGESVLRTEEMERVHEKLQTTTTSSLAAVIAGESNAGKTVLMQQYCDKYSQEYESICWVDAASNAAIAESFRNIASLAGFKIHDESGNLFSVTQQANIVYGMLTAFSKKKTLFIFDNFEPGTNLMSFIPVAHEKLAIIFISRNIFGEQYSGIRIKALTHEKNWQSHSNQTIQALEPLPEQQLQRNDKEDVNIEEFFYPLLNYLSTPYEDVFSKDILDILNLLKDKALLNKGNKETILNLLLSDKNKPYVYPLLYLELKRLDTLGILAKHNNADHSLKFFSSWSTVEAVETVINYVPDRKEAYAQFATYLRDPNFTSGISGGKLGSVSIFLKNLEKNKAIDSSFNVLELLDQPLASFESLSRQYSMKKNSSIFFSPTQSAQTSEALEKISKGRYCSII